MLATAFLKYSTHRPLHAFTLQKVHLLCTCLVAAQADALAAEKVELQSQRFAAEAQVQALQSQLAAKEQELR
jgi:hypothetical protein